MNTLNKILSFILILLVLLFCFSLFKNIQYPLLWNDEADTTMFATRIIKLGYPKVHDGKNVINQTQNQNHTVSINEKMDAFIEVDWLQYYFASPFVSLSELTNNMYLKTALIRIPFAIIGFLGLFFMTFPVVNVFITAISKRLFLILFFLLELLSISLVLHLREVRYYSLQIFITGVLLYVYIRYRYLHENKSRRIPLMTFVFLLLLLFTFRPAFFAFLILFVLFEVEYLFSTIRSELVHDKPPRQSNLKICKVKKISHKVLRAVTPFAILLILLIPYFIFFKTFSFTDAIPKQYVFNYETYLIHIGQILKYFWKYEFLSLLVLCKVIIVGMWIKHINKILAMKS